MSSRQSHFPLGKTVELVSFSVSLNSSEQSCTSRLLGFRAGLPGPEVPSTTFSERSCVPGFVLVSKADATSPSGSGDLAGKEMLLSSLNQAESL